MFLFRTIQVQAQNRDAAPVIASGKNATVFISTPDKEGSGFCIHKSGIFVTNAHVVAGFSQVKVVLSPGETDQQVLKARVSHYDSDRDLAVLVADPPVTEQLPDRPSLTVLPLAGSDSLFETKSVAVFGFPFGGELATDERDAPAVTVTLGRITSLRKFQGELKEIQLDAAVNPGNSGGPVIDDQGQLVDIIHAGVSGAQGVNFALPTASLRQLLKEPEVHFDLPVLEWKKRFDKQAFQVQVAPFPLFTTGAGDGGAFDLEVAVGYDDNWRDLTVQRVENGGKNTEFKVSGSFYEENVTPNTSLTYRMIVRQNGVVVGAREDDVPLNGSPFGRVLTFDGKNDRIETSVKNWPALGNTPHSVQMWIRPDALPAKRAWPILLGNGGFRALHWLYAPNGELTVGVMFDTAAQVKTTLPVGKWANITTTFGNGVLKLYVNGELIAQANAKFDIEGDGAPAVPLYVGKGHLGEDFFSGAIRDLRIWDRELSEDDIRTNLIRDLPANSPGLLLYWPLDEGEGDTIHDRSNHGNDTTLASKDRWVPLDVNDIEIAH